ncbi:MAG TPA: fumarylacetoacetate hydrolase family protein [Burkholderiaceae bacterium]|nr:fumarylacetoacetate hydrolase family protein [Burkholderiaceae bacterium]
MKLRRIWSDELAGPQLRALQAGGWQDAADQDGLANATGSMPRGSAATPMALLPFEPLSFRDFMLYEKHVIDSTRGYVRRFMPGTYRVARAYERVTGQTFPRFKPKPLWYRQPIYYMSNHLSFVASGVPVRTPAYTTALDYELELGFVLSRPLFNASPEQALGAIGAFVVLCDFSARDIQREEMESGFGPQKAKHFLSSMSCTAATADEILPKVQQLQATVEIDGNVVVRTSTSGMQHTLGEVLAHASREEHLYPGELFGTGTLPGGSGLENGHWLRPGCELRLTIDGVGEIRHRID